MRQAVSQLLIATRESSQVAEQARVAATEAKTAAMDAKLFAESVADGMSENQ